MWTATCLSDDSLSKDGFITEESAIEWVVDNHLCDMCKDEGWSSACAAEWLIIETEKLESCNNLSEIFEAAGMVNIK